MHSASSVQFVKIGFLMRLSSLAILIIFSFVTSITIAAWTTNNDMIYPIVYTAFYDNDYEHPEMNVMDVNTGNVLHTISFSCPNSFSPDRSFLTYAPQFSSTRYLLNIATGDVKEIAQDTLGLYWSQDSTRLAFLSFNSYSELERILTVYEVTTDQYIEIGRNTGIWTINWVEDNLYFSILEANFVQLFRWDGEEVQMLSEISLPDTLHPQVNSSANGQAMVISSLVQQGDFERDYLLVNFATEDVILLQDEPHNQQIIWHPDGQKFLFANADNDLVSYNIKDNIQQTLFTSDGIITNVSWSLNGQYIVYTIVYIQHRNATIVSHRSLYLYDVLTNQTTEIRNHIGTRSGTSRWISDTQLVYFRTNGAIEHNFEIPNLNDLYLYDVVTTETISLTSTPNTDEYFWCQLG